MLDTAKIDVFGNPTDFAQFAKNAIFGKISKPFFEFPNKPHAVLPVYSTISGHDPPLGKRS